MTLSLHQAQTESHAQLSRRSFLGHSTLALSTVALGRPIISRGPGQERARAETERTRHHSELISAAATPTGYIGLASNGDSAILVELRVAVSGSVSVGQSLNVGFPPAFVPAQVAAGEAGLFVSGWTPFTLERHTYTDTIEDIPAAERIYLPLDYVSRGVYQVETLGLRPAVFQVDANGVALAVDLPSIPGSPPIAGVTHIVSPAADDLVLLVEHSPNRESVYAAAVTVVQRIQGRWSVTPLAQDLGESGPNSLAAAGEQVVAGLTPWGQSSTIYQRRTSTSTWVRGPQFRDQPAVLAIAARKAGGRRRSPEDPMNACTAG